MENINKSLINKLRTKDREFGVIGSFYYKITKRIFDILFRLSPYYYQNNISSSDLRFLVGTSCSFA